MLGAPRRQITFPAPFRPLPDPYPGAQAQQERGPGHQCDNQPGHPPLMPRLPPQGKRAVSDVAPQLN
jgi:hypothetical protein